MAEELKESVAIRNVALLIVLLNARIKELEECISIEIKYDEEFLGYLDLEFIETLKEQIKESKELIKTLERIHN